MPSTPLPFRPGRPDELARLVAIDDDACTLYEEAGRGVELPPAHADFARAEQSLWGIALALGRVTVAVTTDDEPIGFASSGVVDGEAHLQQISVRRAWMQRGLGRALVEHAKRAAGGALWLTTYADIAWNAPAYERMGFVRVAEDRCGPEVRRILAEERRALPEPDQRVAMVWRAHG